ncbi:MAG: type IV secretory system conjugative DNA transfer family protein, partial [Candidatus Levybacteria bacterium]|nr:type IV secretory system conjugative DNA transfer family protein [Candidatus Levybacteria bacterium]
VTAKIGRFLFSPTAKRILEQPKSTINFDELMNSGKIIICNLSQGKLGEDTFRLLGITIMTKIQQAALKRSNMPENQRKPFYLYVDEFQNFATHSFTKMLSEGRKYKLRVTLAEQSTSQQDDRNIVNVILANVTTVVCFRTANYVDEELMLNQFAPYVEKGEIANLPKYNFYIKVSALEPEEPFSGETIYTPLKKDDTKIEKLIGSSRKNWAIIYQKPKDEDNKIVSDGQVEESSSGARKTINKDGLPKKIDPKNSVYA